MFFNFKGKKALVTGGGSGLGRECALLFAKGGADVLIADLLPERCEKVAEKVEKPVFIAKITQPSNSAACFFYHLVA